jgi:hypothetical protein
MPFWQRKKEPKIEITLDVDDPIDPAPSAPTFSDPAYQHPTAVEFGTEEDRISTEAAQRAIEEINAEEIRRGQPYTAEERRTLIMVAGKKYIDEWLLRQSLRGLVQDMNDAMSHQAAGLDGSLREISAKLDEPRDAVGRAIKFQQEHPFLAGLLGAEVVDRLGKK